MKKFLILFIIATYFFSTTELVQLLKIPVLINHFVEHAEEDNSITFMDYMVHHYGGHEKDADWETDMKLPFMQHSDLLNIEYETFETSRERFQKENSRQTRELEVQKQTKEREVIIEINDFKQPSDAISSKFKDWRSDVNSLPDSTHLELISEYQNFLARLENDNLPKFEKKYLNLKI